MPLWRIPDPEAVAALARAEREEKEKAGREKEQKAKERKARAARERAALAEHETKRRQAERAEWLATHPPPTVEQLAALLAEKAPNLKAAMEAKRK